jgi:hypothetical protein
VVFSVVASFSMTFSSESTLGWSRFDVVTVLHRSYSSEGGGGDRIALPQPHLPAEVAVEGWIWTYK